MGRSAEFWLSHLTLLKKAYTEGISYADVAEQIGGGVTESAVAGAIRRHVKGLKLKRGKVTPKARRTDKKDPTRIQAWGSWDESRLIEKWEDRKARRALERAQLTNSDPVDIRRTG